MNSLVLSGDTDCGCSGLMASLGNISSVVKRYNPSILGLIKQDELSPCDCSVEELEIPLNNEVSPILDFVETQYLSEVFEHKYLASYINACNGKYSYNSLFAISSTVDRYETLERVFPAKLSKFMSVLDVLSVYENTIDLASTNVIDESKYESRMVEALKLGPSLGTAAYLARMSDCDLLTVEALLEKSSKFRKSFIKASDGSNVYMLNSKFAFWIDAWRTFRHINSRKFQI